MSKYGLKFIIGIILTGGLVAGRRASGAVAGPRAPNFERSCQRLAQLAAYGWADLERSVNISCLSSNAIPEAAFETMVREFLADCTDVVSRRLGPSSGPSPRPEARLSRDEITRMFIRRYDPVFKRYCSGLNPGKGLITRPGRLTEA